jgi:hypothetical protein
MKIDLPLEELSPAGTETPQLSTEVPPHRIRTRLAGSTKETQLMSTVGQIEKKTQQRVVNLFKQQLDYDYLGDWADRPNNTNIEADLLRSWLLEQGVEANLASRAIFELNKAANDASKGLYDRNKAVYELLRYGVKIRPEVGENTQTVWLINWKEPKLNHFAIAEEVTVKGADANAPAHRRGQTADRLRRAFGHLPLSISLARDSQSVESLRNGRGDNSATTSSTMTVFNPL